MNAVRAGRCQVVVLSVAIALALASPALASPEGQAAVDQVSMANYIDLMDNYLFTHVGDNRGPTGPDLGPCRDNIRDLMLSYGLSVTLEPFTYSGTTYHNVVGELQGSLTPSIVYIIGAHYDSVSNPGADDNASGVALVLETARILSQYDSDATVRFIAFSMEEVGLVGSEAYVDAHFLDDIRGMVSADMVAYNTGTDYANIYGRTASDPIKNALASSIDEYVPGLTHAVGGDTPYSDHAPFEAAGFQACLLIEGEVWSNPYYHTSQDSYEQPGNLDFEYAAQMTQAMVGWLTDAAGVNVNVDRLAFSYPFDRIEHAAPIGGTRLRVEVSGLGSETPEPGTALLHTNVAGGGWTSTSMVQLADNVYDAVFPATACGAEIQYYVSAEATDAEVYTDPPDAPATVFAVSASYGTSLVYEDDFETDQGWLATNLGASSGDWQRGVPVDDPNWDYDPASDSDGSGQCWLTDNTLGNTDVDDGAVRLESPVFDMTGANAALHYDYFLRLTNSGGIDRLLVEANNSLGSGTWTQIALHNTDGGLTWRNAVITADDLINAGVQPTDSMVLRFTANDEDSPSIVESGLDAFAVSSLICTPLADCDHDGNGTVDLYDFAQLQQCFSGDGYAHPDGMGCGEAFDAEGDGDVDLVDHKLFATMLTGP